jgi:hypothetical protein
MRRLTNFDVDILCVVFVSAMCFVAWLVNNSILRS